MNINRTNLDILLSQNDILPLLKKVNHQSKILGRQVTLSEFVQQKNVSKNLNIGKVANRSRFAARALPKPVRA